MLVTLLSQPKRFVRPLPWWAAAVILCATASHAAEPATITFTLDFPASDPERYSISVSADGHSKYDCSAKISQDSDEREAYQAEFDLSPAGRKHVFDLAAQAHFFAGKIDSGNSKLAFTGSKTLTYKDGERNGSAKYNYSNLPAVQQLT